MFRGHETSLDPSIKLVGDQWVEARAPGLPPTLFASGFLKPCLVVTSPHTFIVTGGSSDLLRGNHKRSISLRNDIAIG